MREEEDTNDGGSPFHGVNPAVLVVEGIGIGSASLEAARVSFAAATRQGAPGVGVHSHLILGTLPNTLDNVNFAAVGPIGTCHPERRPNAAGTTGHVGEIQHHKTTSVARFGGQADRIPATARGGVGVIDTPAGLIVGGGE